LIASPAPYRYATEPHIVCPAALFLLDLLNTSASTGLSGCCFV